MCPPAGEATPGAQLARDRFATLAQQALTLGHADDARKLVLAMLSEAGG